MKVISATILILFTVLLTNCDPSQEIHLINDRSEDITIAFFENGESRHSIKNSFSEISTIEGTSLVHLDRGSVDTLWFGIGTWEVNNRLDTFLHYLKRIEVNGRGTTEVYKGKVLRELVRNSLGGELNRILRFDFNKWRGHELNYENLYGSIDSIVRTEDTLRLFNSRYDTVIIRNGISTYLWYDYDSHDELLVKLFHQAIALEKEGKRGANEIYRKIIEFHTPTFFDKQRENSDVNGFFHSATSLAIILSYSYERLSKLDKAIDVLKPYMANSEDHGTKIHTRFFELCIRKYGVGKVRNEFNKAVKNIRRNTIDYPGFDPLVIDVYNAEIGLEKDDDTLSVDEVYAYFKSYEFYELLQ